MQQQQRGGGGGHRHRRGGRGSRAAPRAPTAEDAAYIADISAPLTPGAGDRGATEFVAFLASLPRHTHVTLTSQAALMPECMCLSGALPPPELAELADVVREMLRGAAAAARSGGLPPNAGVVHATVRQYQRLAQEDCEDAASPVQPAQVWAFTLRPDCCIRLPASMNERSQCVNAFTGAVLPPEEGVQYM